MNPFWILDQRGENPEKKGSSHMGEENNWVTVLVSIFITVFVALMIKTGSWLKAKRRRKDGGIDRKDSLG